MGSTTKNVLTSDLKQLGQGVSEGSPKTDIKKQISKFEELALAANRAGDDAKCKQYQQKIQALNQKMSQGVAEEGPGAIGSGGFGTNYPGTYEETHGKLKNDKMHHNRALTTEDELEEDLSRRGFLRGLSAAATGAALASTGANAMAGQEADPTSLKGLTAEQAAYKLAYQQALSAHPNPNSAMAKLNAQRVAQAAAKAASGNGTHVQGKLVKSEPQAEPSQRIQPTQQQAQPSVRRAGAGMMESAILSGLKKV
jgi:hypothetical protein